ncbi:MAG: tRNA 5-methoxyuridine(34)/uridine 5-oxyacetic acid(34) synthase CmoB [Desulfobacteraceae bacterium]|nr:MAG: tRNA 5-methoxyuridine(34)/uridine 5-oxyacetic acid(34) synthase CmoB [Desulfobacteraceae bacterium]
MERLLENSRTLKLDHCYDALCEVILPKARFLEHPVGNFLTFKKVVDSLPVARPSQIHLDEDMIRIGKKQDIDQGTYDLLFEKLRQLRPWRKGPYDIFGVEIDTEWRSNLKWNRVKDQIKPLKGKRILDIGSSSGYYMFRMAAQDPLMVLGLEPQSSFYYQYLALQSFLKLENVYCIPIVFNDLPMMDGYFDAVFCMGILYHRRSPIDMLKDIHDRMAPGGEIVVENLVIDSHENTCLFPKDRYAKMRNVFFIPDLASMASWLSRAGFSNIRCVDVTPTTVEEQRRTPWIKTESLDDFLDPDDPSKTVEGYPAPVRAIFIAEA